MPGLIWAPSARRDLIAIDNYFEPRDPRVALEMLLAIQRAAARLTEYPRIGRAIDPPFRVLGVRSTPYLIPYRLRDAGVEIVRVRHRRENWAFEIEAEL